MFYNNVCILQSVISITIDKIIEYDTGHVISFENQTFITVRKSKNQVGIGVTLDKKQGNKK